MLPRFAGSSVEVNTAAKPAVPQDEDLTGSRPGAPAASRPRLTTTVALGHVGIHWVQATTRLVGALMQSPLRLTAWRAHERSQPMGGTGEGGYRTVGWYIPSCVIGLNGNWMFFRHMQAVVSVIKPLTWC
jgi:hypothetical protein